MYSKTSTPKSTASCSEQIEEQMKQKMRRNTKRLAEAIESSEGILIGAGAGLSASAGLTYSGERFEKYFRDFREKYGIRDMYSGGFYPFETLEEYWAWWSRHISVNRYMKAPAPVYDDLFRIVEEKDYFVLTTNVDHQFQMAGFDKERLFYTQGDYGLWQCSKPCHQKTYDNEEAVREMIRQQKGMRIPSELIPRCPKCGSPMTMNLRSDDTFVEDEGWHAAASRYEEYLRSHQGQRMLYLELGVGMNTPGIIKYPFWQMTYQNPKAVYACVNQGAAYAPQEINARAVCIDEDIGNVLKFL